MLDEFSCGEDDAELLLEYKEEAEGIQAALEAGLLNRIAADCLIWYADRDGYFEDRSWRRQVNLAFHSAGMLEKHDPNTIRLGSKPKLVVIEGEKYESAI